MIKIKINLNTAIKIKKIRENKVYFHMLKIAYGHKIRQMDVLKN